MKEGRAGSVIFRDSRVTEEAYRPGHGIPAGESGGRAAQSQPQNPELESFWGC